MFIFYFNTFLKEKLLFAKEIIFPVNNLSPEWHQGELENWQELGPLSNYGLQITT